MNIDNYSAEEYRNSLRNISFYYKKIKNELPSEVFKPRPQRLWWLVFNAVLISFCVFSILYFPINILFKIIISIIIGNCLGVLGYLGHEIVHGSVVKSKFLIYNLGSLCFISWGMHAKTWMGWHNKLHHQNTADPYYDPDCFGRVELIKYSVKLIRLSKLLPGSGSILSYTFLFWFFSFHSFNVTWFYSNIYKNKKEKIQSRAFFLLTNILWCSLSILSHPYGFFLFYLIPILVSNFMMMMYIVTNHFINPLTEGINDPLVNSLTLRSNKIINWLHLNMSYHTEHHLFPHVNPYYAPLVSDLLKKNFPEKYNEMPHLKALYLVYKKPKFFFNEVVLIHPVTKVKTATLVLDEF